MLQEGTDILGFVTLSVVQTCNRFNLCTPPWSTDLESLGWVPEISVFWVFRSFWWLLKFENHRWKCDHKPRKCAWELPEMQSFGPHSRPVESVCVLSRSQVTGSTLWGAVEVWGVVSGDRRMSHPGWGIAEHKDVVNPRGKEAPWPVWDAALCTLPHGIISEGLAEGSHSYFRKVSWGWEGGPEEVSWGRETRSWGC